MCVAGVVRVRLVRKGAPFESLGSSMCAVGVDGFSQVR